MKLEFLENINEYNDHLIRLYEFDFLQAQKFRQLIQNTIIENRMPLDLSTVDFIQPVNCKVILRISESDIGFTSADNKNFFNDLTLEGYEQMINLLAPFCIDDKIYKFQTYQWLDDTLSDTQFLFSPYGHW